MLHSNVHYLAVTTPTAAALIQFPLLERTVVCCPKPRRTMSVLGIWLFVTKLSLEPLSTSGFVPGPGKLTAAVLGIEHTLSLHSQTKKGKELKSTNYVFRLFSYNILMSLCIPLL